MMMTTRHPGHGTPAGAGVRPGTVGRLLAAVVVAGVGGLLPPLAVAQSAVQRSIYDTREYLLEFDVRQGADCAGVGAHEQVTILFSNQPMDTDTAPSPVLGEDIVAEFSFSTRDFVNDQLRFRRRVRDRSFLDARFIRVVNAGDGGWCGASLALSVNGQRQFQTALKPRKGRAGDAIQDWNRAGWRGRAYWEGSLPALLRSSAPSRK